MTPRTWCCGLVLGAWQEWLSYSLWLSYSYCVAGGMEIEIESKGSFCCKISDNGMALFQFTGLQYTYGIKLAVAFGDLTLSLVFVKR